MADKKKVRFGLLPKLVLGVFIPILVAFAIIGSLVFYSWDLGEFRFISIKDIGSESLKELSVTSTKESKSSMDRMGEKIIREKAIDVAAQMEIFIKSRPPRMKREEILKRIRAQMPIGKKLKMADYVVDNGGDKDATVGQVRKIWRQIVWR